MSTSYPGQFIDSSGLERFVGTISFTDAANQPQEANTTPLRFGTGDPNGAQPGAVGDLFIRTDGDPGADTYLYACTVASDTAATYVALVTH